MMWLNQDLEAISEIMRQMPESVVDLQQVFGSPANLDFLLPDGLHPSINGQKAIVKTLVRKLSTD